jgi:MFS family permease
MFARFRSLKGTYPRQFWLLFWGLLISTIGSSMIWPFLMVYVSEKLKLPMTQVASLMTINAMVGIVCSFLAGPVVDRIGRKWVMIISLAGTAVYFLLMSRATTLLAFSLLMALNGIFGPLYRIGADAMMADLIPADKRIDGYSMLRMSNNVGVALGPAIGGFIAASSYTLAFYIAAAGMLAYCALMVFGAQETLPQQDASKPVEKERFAGYGRVLRDRPFIFFVIGMIFNQMCAALIWVLLAVYAKQNFQVPESAYGWIPTTNAIMVVLFQVLVTRFTKKYAPLKMLALGSLFYAVATLSVAFGRGFWGFWLSMVIMTIGELILVPTSSTYTANRAPAEMRGRYMSIYGLTWGVASGVGPVFGGFLNDTFGPRTIWYGGGVVGLVSMSAFMALARIFPHSKPDVTTDETQVS